MMQGKKHMKTIQGSKTFERWCIAGCLQKMISMFIKSIPALKKRMFTPFTNGGLYSFRITEVE
jgi:hypothetical protein